MQRTDVQFVSFLTSSANPTLASQSSHLRLPFILDRLDDEAQRGTDFVDIFIHNLLHNSSFPSIVKAPSPVSCFQSPKATSAPLQHQNAHLLVLETGLPQYRQHFRQSLNLGLIGAQEKTQEPAKLAQDIDHVPPGGIKKSP